MKIIFVCTGNTCRSPMAEGILKKYIEDNNIENVEVSSAGLYARDGSFATREAKKAAAKFGADLSYHVAHNLTRCDIRTSDLIVCMNTTHYEELKTFVDNKKLYLLGSGISDPYGQSQEEYDKCALSIYSGIKELTQETGIFKNDTKYQIVKMEKVHIAEIAELEKICFSSPWSQNALAEELLNEQSHFLAAVANEKVLGYIGVQEIVGEAYITNIAVFPEYRRRGIAQALLQKAVDAAQNRNCAFITLEVRKSNCSAIALYEKLDFKNVGERKNFYTEPTENAIIMTKNFN